MVGGFINSSFEVPDRTETIQCVPSYFITSLAQSLTKCILGEVDTRQIPLEPGT